MKHLILVLIAIWAIFLVTDMAWSPKGSIQHRSLAPLAESPVHRLSDPYRNAYFYLIGFAASSALDPAKIGYDMWIESQSITAGRTFDYGKPGRFDLHIPLSFREAVPSWDAEDPLTAFRGKGSSIRPTADRYRILLDRYDHWLGMPFEDWGFGQPASPRYEDILIAHRLYVSDAFARSTDLGMDHLLKEFLFWRTALRAAATIATKVAAQVVIQDDVKLLSRLLTKPSVDRTIVAMTLQLTVPLTSYEYSLRWPIQHQVALAMRGGDAASGRERGASALSYEETAWLSDIARLPSHALNNIAHPSSRTLFPRLFSERTAELYASFYEALIASSEKGAPRLPKLREMTGAMPRGAIETLLHPVLVEPEWEIFYYQLMETDAHLRLTSLQVQLRKPGVTAVVPIRLAEVGSQYFDPFTGLPMLWSPTQQKIYSVGRDRLDDGGDPSFDIAVPAVIAAPRAARPSPIGSAPARRL